MKQIFVMLLFLGLLISCDSNSSTPKKVDSPQQTLNTFKSLWKKSKIENYTFVMKRSCFCPVEENTQVFVKNNTIVEAKYIPSNRPYNKDQLHYLKTINQYFLLIQESIDKDVYTLTVSYDQTYGYPQNIFIDIDKQMADEEIGYTITHFNTLSEDRTTICTADYTPVCAKVNIECIILPCENIEETFSNRCTLNANPNTSYLYDGECK